MVAGFLGPLSTSEQISACRCFSASLFISKENNYNIPMFPCCPIIPILLLYFGLSITKGRWTLKCPWSLLLEGAIMLVACGFQLSERAVKISVIGELHIIEGYWPFGFILTCPYPPNIHKCIFYGSSVSLWFSTWTWNARQGQWLGSWVVDRAPYGGSWLHTTQQRAAMPNSQS